MVRVMLKGVYTVRARLASGKRVAYHYAWRNGPRLRGEPGSPEFLASYQEAHETRFETKRKAVETVSDLCDAWTRSPEYDGLADGSRRRYAGCIAAIKAKFGTMPISALGSPRIRLIVLNWRDSMKHKPRTADYHAGTFARLVSWSVDRGYVAQSHLTRIGRLSKPGKRADIVWTTAQIERLSLMPKALADACWLALWTGQRQADVLALRWSDIDGEFVRLRQSKTGTVVAVYICATLRDILNRIPKVSPTVLTNSRKRPWTGSGFRASLSKAMEKARIDGVTFHDIRGTMENRLWEAGCTEGEVATVMGRKVKTAESMNAYFRRADPVSRTAITKLESTFGEQDCKMACKMVRVGTGKGRASA